MVSQKELLQIIADHPGITQEEIFILVSSRNITQITSLIRKKYARKEKVPTIALYITDEGLACLQEQENNIIFEEK